MFEMTKRHEKNTKKQRKKTTKKKPLSFKKRKFYITMRKIVCRKSSRKSHKKQETPFLLIAKNANRRNAEAPKKFFEKEKKRQKERESKTPFKISFRKHNIVLT